MTIVQQVVCDADVLGHRCAARFTRTRHDGTDLAAAAVAAGWRVDWDGDLCPTHAKSSTGS